MQPRFPYSQGPPVSSVNQVSLPPGKRPIATNTQPNRFSAGFGMSMNAQTRPIYSKVSPSSPTYKFPETSGRPTVYDTTFRPTFSSSSLVGASAPLSNALGQIRGKAAQYENATAAQTSSPALPGRPPFSSFPVASAVAPPLSSVRGYPPQSSIVPSQPPSMRVPNPPERTFSAERPGYVHGAHPSLESSSMSSSFGVRPPFPSASHSTQIPSVSSPPPSVVNLVKPPPPPSVVNSVKPPPSPLQSARDGGSPYKVPPPLPMSAYTSYSELPPKLTSAPIHSTQTPMANYANYPEPPPKLSAPPRGSSYTMQSVPLLSSSGYSFSSSVTPPRPPLSGQMMQKPWTTPGESEMQHSTAPMPQPSQDGRSVGPPGFIAPHTAPYSAEKAMNASTHPLGTQAQRSMHVEEMLQFNAHAHYVFPSCSKLPNSARVKEKAHVPIGFVVAPLASIPDGYPEVPTVNFGTAPLVRCKRCHAYINPFVRWQGNGDRWFCNLCGNMNDTPAYYTKPLDEQKKRVDRMERPELSCGSIEIIASADYMARPPQPPAFLFLIEVSADAVYCGLVEAACSAIKRVLSSGELPGGSRTKVGIITFDSSIHFYNFSSELSQPQMLVIPGSDVFLPLPDEIMVNAQESMKGLLALLEQLPSMWSKNTTVETCMGSAVDAAFMAMNHIGGKLSIFLSTLPTIGKFALSKHSRSSSKQKTTAAELEMQYLRTMDDSYKSIGADLAQYQISVDLFVCSTQSVDLATLFPIAKLTAGEIHYYPKFQIRLHGDRLGEELLECFKKILAWEAVMRFRVSRGWRISKWFGHFYMRTGEILIVPNCRAEQTFSVLLEMDENVAQENVAFMQAALLYSNSAGERRIRIHTFCLPVIHNPNEVYASMDVSVCASLLCQQAVDVMHKKTLADARAFLQQSCAQIIATQGATPSYQNKILAMYILGLLKSSAFRESKDVSADMRIYHLSRLESASLNLQIAYFYPRMLSLHNLDLRHGTEDEGRCVILPDAMPLSSSGMTEDGVYLLEDGETMLMWIGRGVKSSWLEATFGVISLDYLHPDFAEAHIGASGDSLGKRIAIILQELRRLRGVPFIRMIVLKQGDPLEYKFFMSLIEDQTECMRTSLQEFLSKMGQRGVVASANYRTH